MSWHALFVITDEIKVRSTQNRHLVQVNNIRLTDVSELPKMEIKIQRYNQSKSAEFRLNDSRARYEDFSRNLHSCKIKM